MCHYSKPSYILHGHVEGRGENQSSDPIDGILIYDKLYVCEQVAEWIRHVHVSCSVYFYRVCVCVCTAFHTSVLISVIIDYLTHQFTVP